MLTVIKVRVEATLSGIAVSVDCGPSSNDPLGQGKFERFDTLDAALDAIPRVVKEHIGNRLDAPQGRA